MPKYNDFLIPGNYFHVFNRAVGDEKMFRTTENYRYFLQKFYEYITPVATLYCYSLLPNHFHTLIRVKEQEEIEQLYISRKRKPIAKYDSIFFSDFIMEQFSNFFNSYTKSYNKVYKRKGKLFMDHLKRNQVSDDSYFTKIVHYIHTNPVHHGYCNSPKEWSYSSYNAMIKAEFSQLPRHEILNWFGGRTTFIQIHEQPVKHRQRF